MQKKFVHVIVKSSSLMHSFSSSTTVATILLWTYIVNFPLWFTSIEAIVQLPPNVTFPAVFTFGDSIVDQGNNNNRPSLAKGNFPPYGKDFMGGLATGRFSNGKTPPDMIAAELGIKELVPAYLDPNLQSQDLLTGVSFASGGSGYDPQTAKTATAYTMADQLEMLKEYSGKLIGLVGEERTSYILANSLFLPVAGSDDFVNNYFGVGLRRLHYDVPAYADFLVSLASDFIKKTYELGGRRIGVFSLPPIGCLPSQRTLAGGVYRMCPENYNQAAQLYNNKLSSMINSLRHNLPQSRVVYIDIYNPVVEIIQNPQNYGFDIVDRGCCGSGIIEVAPICNRFSKTCPDRSKFLFWDSFHPTEIGYTVIVDQILDKYLSQLY